MLNYRILQPQCLKSKLIYFHKFSMLESLKNAIYYILIAYKRKFALFPKTTDKTILIETFVFKIFFEALSRFCRLSLTDMIFRIK